MMRDVTIKRLKDDSLLEEVLTMYKKTPAGTGLSGKLIFYDENFKTYFANTLKNQIEFVFGVFENEQLCGFLHVKKRGETLLLNNIYLSAETRGRGLGTKVLATLLHKPFVRQNNIKYMVLDVFQSNVSAKKWYDEIGFKEEKRWDWYFVSVPSHKKRPKNIIQAFDKNNFKSLFYKGAKVATIINEAYIVIHDRVALNYQTSLPFLVKEERGKTHPNGSKRTTINTTIRMRATVTTLTDKLSKRLQR